MEIKDNKQYIKSLVGDIKRHIEELSLDDVKNLDPTKFVKAVNETLLNSFDTSITGNLMLDSNDHQYLEKQVLLGKGSFGSVYRCIAKQNIHYVDKKVSIQKNMIVICKEVPNLFDDKKKHQIKSEIIAHFTINGSGCSSPKLFGYFHDKTPEEKDNIYVIMEYVYGITLETKLFGYYIFPSDKILDNLERWMREVEKTLICLHQHDIVHRDVKVDNIIINNLSGDDTSKAVLIDYGLSCKIIERCSSYMYSAYTSPLKLYNSKNKMERTLDVEERNDMFALGMTIIDCLYILYNKKRYSKILGLSENSFENVEQQIINVYNILLKWNSNTKNLLTYAIELLNKGLLKPITLDNLNNVKKIIEVEKNEEIDSDYYDGDKSIDVKKLNEITKTKLNVTYPLETSKTFSFGLNKSLNTTPLDMLSVTAPSDYITK